MSRRTDWRTRCSLDEIERELDKIEGDLWRWADRGDRWRGADRTPSTDPYFWN